MFRKLKRQQFLFEELVKRDFKKKYKRTARDYPKICVNLLNGVE